MVARRSVEDELVFAFHDIQPWAPVHFLIVPKAHIVSMAHVGPEHEALIGTVRNVGYRFVPEGTDAATRATLSAEALDPADALTP